ncbi:hypothetical protein Tco_0079992 [Tanacetum coccineum]
MFVCGSKLHLIKDCDFYNCVESVPCKSKAASVPAGSRNSPASDTAGGSDPAASRNRPAVNSAGRPNPLVVQKGQHLFSTVDKFSAVTLGGKKTTIMGGPKSNGARSSTIPHGFTLMNPQGRHKSELALGHLKVKGGIVKFGGGDGRISGKGTIRTSKLDFENVYYVEELQHFNFDLLSQICTQDHDSDSEVDEQVIVVPSFPSNRFAGPSSSNGPRIMERNADYAEELAKLQRQEYEAKDAAARYGYLFSQATAEILCQAEAEIRDQGVSAVKDPAGVDSAVKDSAGVDSADGVSTGSPSADSDPAGGNPADSFPPAGSVEPADESNPAVSSSVSADLNSVYADESTLPPGQQLGTSENTTRFPVPSDVCMDQLSSGIFTSSSYDDDFRATLTNLAPAVEVNLVPTKRVNTIHPQSQILGDLASPVLTRSRAHKSKFGESAFIGYVHDQQRINHTDQLHCLSLGYKQRGGHCDDDVFAPCQIEQSACFWRFAFLYGLSEYIKMDVKMPSLKDNFMACKKRVLATSSTEAEYVAALKLLCTGPSHIDDRHHFIRDAMIRTDTVLKDSTPMIKCGDLLTKGHIDGIFFKILSIWWSINCDGESLFRELRLWIMPDGFRVHAGRHTFFLLGDSFLLIGVCPAFLPAGYWVSDDGLSLFFLQNQFTSSMENSAHLMHCLSLRPGSVINFSSSIPQPLFVCRLLAGDDPSCDDDASNEESAAVKNWLVETAEAPLCTSLLLRFPLLGEPTPEQQLYPKTILPSSLPCLRQNGLSLPLSPVTDETIWPYVFCTSPMRSYTPTVSPPTLPAQTFILNDTLMVDSMRSHLFGLNELLQPTADLLDSAFALSSSPSNVSIDHIPIDFCLNPHSVKDDDHGALHSPLPYGEFKEWEMGVVPLTVQTGLRQAYECLASAPIACTARQMVFSSPWLTAKKESGSPLQTALVCRSNPLIAVTKNWIFIFHVPLGMKKASPRGYGSDWKQLIFDSGCHRVMWFQLMLRLGCLLLLFLLACIVALVTLSLLGIMFSAVTPVLLASKIYLET